MGLYGLEAAEIGAQALVMTREGLDALEKLKEERIASVGEQVAERNTLGAELTLRKSKTPLTRRLNRWNKSSQH